MAKTEIIASDLDGATPASSVKMDLFGKTLEVDLTLEQIHELDAAVENLDRFVRVGKLKRTRTVKQAEPVDARD